MIIDNLYSRMYKQEKGLFDDVYQYEEIPSKLKITLSLIFEREMKSKYRPQHHRYDERLEMQAYQTIHNIICEEHSLPYLYKQFDQLSDFKNSILNFFQQDSNLLIGLDIIQLFCKILDEDTANVINKRMLEHAFGYQFENGLIIRCDTKHTHQELVKPTFLILRDDRFKNADEEYKAAFAAFNRGDYEDVFVQCNKAFESTMKVICEINKFHYKQLYTATKLIELLKNNNFIAGYNESMLNGLVQVLSAVSTLRNNNGGHGKGAQNQITDVSYVNLTLHLTASKILFLMERQAEFTMPSHAQ